MTNDRRVIQELVALRKLAGLRQVDVAAKLGLAVSTVGMFETCYTRNRSPSLWVLLRYADAVGARIEVRMGQR